MISRLDPPAKPPRGRDVLLFQGPLDNAHTVASKETVIYLAHHINATASDLLIHDRLIAACDIPLVSTRPVF